MGVHLAGLAPLDFEGVMGIPRDPPILPCLHGWEGRALQAPGSRGGYQSEAAF